MSNKISNQRKESPKLSENSEGELVFDDESNLEESLYQAVGTNDPDVLLLVLEQLSSIVPSWQDESARINLGLAILSKMEPSDPLEILLITQMIGSHNLAIKFMEEAALPGQTLDQVSQKTNRATKMMRTFTAQLEALDKHRRKGEQKVTVEHVTVNEGGQAIVGPIMREGGGHGRKS